MEAVTVILPALPGVRLVEPFYVDTGLLQRAPTRATITRINRPGGHMGAQVTYPPMPADIARVFISRLLEAKEDGLRMPFPLTGVDQGDPGNTVINGAGAAGTSLPVRGMTTGYQWKEGFWVSVVDPDGIHYLHNVRNSGQVLMGGGVLNVRPALRGDFPDGSLVILDAPRIEGAITSDIAWPLPHQKIVTIEFTIEEAA
ncbi:hypothetical protein [Novosphingobium album (ex Liu et al. 2023)]|uniref:Uncharacterized protein n=1 Tax=Novosphingobium album (ex Liu et al. 2023) TaxID=3031130 RepID=A0ABT5WPA6_9SPHN|nr:hypothetical protein [Novosphingobium album (ex Liu et al. 2023)]MDE8651878.1 hypothetical protein [Novosphingobium album (ex Liu et al. 2023)]